MVVGLWRRLSLIAPTHAQLGRFKRLEAFLTVETLGARACSIPVHKDASPFVKESFKLGRRGEGKQVGEVVKLDVRCNEAVGQLLKALDADFVNKDVDKRGSFARR